MNHSPLHYPGGSSHVIYEILLIRHHYVYKNRKVDRGTCSSAPLAGARNRLPNGLTGPQGTQLPLTALPVCREDKTHSPLLLCHPSTPLCPPWQTIQQTETCTVQVDQIAKHPFSQICACHISNVLERPQDYPWCNGGVCHVEVLVVVCERADTYEALWPSIWASLPLFCYSRLHMNITTTIKGIVHLTNKLNPNVIQICMIFRVTFYFLQIQKLEISTVKALMWCAAMVLTIQTWGWIFIFEWTVPSIILCVWNIYNLSLSFFCFLWSSASSLPLSVWVWMRTKWCSFQYSCFMLASCSHGSSEAQSKPYYSDYSPTRLLIHKMCTSHYLDLFITIVIGLNVITMSMEHYQQPKVDLSGLNALVNIPLGEWSQSICINTMLL